MPENKMTVKGKAQTPQPSKAVRALKGNQKTPQSAPSKGKGTPAAGGKANAGQTPVPAKATNMTPKKLAAPKGTPKQQKSPAGRKTRQNTKKTATEDSNDDEDEEDFVTGDENEDSSENGVSDPKAASPKTPHGKDAKTAAKPLTPAQPKTPKGATPAKGRKLPTPAPRQIPLGALPKSDQSSFDLDAEYKKDLERRDERDSRCLFVKNLPATATEEKVKALSKEIEAVKIRPVFRRGKRVPCYGYLTFKSEEVARRNHKKLQGAKLGDTVLVVDFIGKASENLKRATSKVAPTPVDLDPLKLYVTGFAQGTQTSDLEALFPGCSAAIIPTKKYSAKPAGFAFIEFTNETLARKCHDEVEGKKLEGYPLTVMFAKLKPERSARKRKAVNKKQAKKAQEKAKKPKTEAAVAKDDEGDSLDAIDFDSDDEDDEEDDDEDIDDSEDDDDDDDDEN